MMRIIPKLDIKGENLVKGINLEGLRVLGDPRSFINHYYKNGADEFIIHDIVASLYLRNQLESLIKEISKNIFIPIIVGGGIKNLKDIEKLLKSGADRVFLNTNALGKKKFIKDACKYFGYSTIVISIEAVEIENKFFCSKDYGRELTKIKAEDWLKEVEQLGVLETIVTSVDNDGTGQGFNLKLAEIIQKKIAIKYIINGGFKEIKHINELLKVCSPSGIALGSALHYKIYKDFELKFKKEGNVEFIKKKDSYFIDKKTKNLTLSQIKKKFNQ
jgi:cyclase